MRCLWGRSGFGGCILLSLSTWGDSGLTTRSSWDGLNVLAFFLSLGQYEIGLFGLLGIRSGLGNGLG